MPGGRETLFSLSVLVCVGMSQIKRASQVKTALPGTNCVHLQRDKTEKYSAGTTSPFVI